MTLDQLANIIGWLNRTETRLNSAVREAQKQVSELEECRNAVHSIRQDLRAELAKIKPEEIEHVQRRD